MAQVSYKGSLTRYRRFLQAAQKQPLLQASLFLILSLLLLIVLVVVALKPTLVTIGQLLGQIKQQQAVEVELDKKIAQVQAAQQAYQEVRDQLGVLDKALPTSAVWGEWADGILNEASISGTKVNSFNLEDISVTGTATREGQIKFSLTMEGSLDQLRNFADRIEGGGRIAVLSKLGTTRSEGSVMTGVINGIIGFVNTGGSK